MVVWFHIEIELRSHKSLLCLKKVFGTQNHHKCGYPAPFLAHLEKKRFLKKSVLEMSETLLSSLYKQVTPWVSGKVINSTTAVWFRDAKLV